MYWLLAGYLLLSNMDAYNRYKDLFLSNIASVDFNIKHD